MFSSYFVSVSRYRKYSGMTVSYLKRPTNVALGQLQAFCMPRHVRAIPTLRVYRLSDRICMTLLYEYTVEICSLIVSCPISLTVSTDACLLIRPVAAGI